VKASSSQQAGVCSSKIEMARWERKQRQKGGHTHCAAPPSKEAVHSNPNHSFLRRSPPSLIDPAKSEAKQSILLQHRSRQKSSGTGDRGGTKKASRAERFTQGSPFLAQKE